MNSAKNRSITTNWKKNSMIGADTDTSEWNGSELSFSRFLCRRFSVVNASLKSERFKTYAER